MRSLILDIDGVFADCVRGAMDHYNRTDIPYADVRWNISDQFGMTYANFWGGFGYDFWANLPLHQDGFDVLHLIENDLHGLKVGIITSPMPTPGCVEGKRKWIGEYLPQYKDVLFGSAKHLAAHDNSVLIDDYDENIQNFRAAGGHALTIPRPWNERRGECDINGNFDVATIANELFTLLET